MAYSWISRRENAAYHQVKIYCSICGILIKPDTGTAIFKELSKEWQYSKDALYCTATVLKTGKHNIKRIPLSPKGFSTG
jgi:hypothetical protein